MKKKRTTLEAPNSTILVTVSYIFQFQILHTRKETATKSMLLGRLKNRLGTILGGRLELWCGVGGVDVVGTKEHEFASGKTVGERSQTQLVVMVVLSVDDDVVDVDTRVEHGQLTAGRQLPQTYTAVRRTGRHELVARGYARAQHLQRNPCMAVSLL